MTLLICMAGMFMVAAAHQNVYERCILRGDGGKEKERHLLVSLSLKIANLDKVIVQLHCFHWLE
jgi:hypothetical protein